MQHPDEGTIHAWLDDALSNEEGATVEAHVATCGDCAAAVAEARGLIAASSRIVLALDIVPRGVIPQRTAPVRPAWYSTTQFRAAAAVLLVAGASMLLVQGRDGKSVKDLSQQVMSMPSAETSQAQSADAAADEMASARQEPEASPVIQPPPAAANTPLAKAIDGRVVGAAIGEADKKVSLRESQPQTRAPLAAPMLGNVVATGVASEAVAAGLTVVSRDSTASERTTVFQVEPGVTVSLTESFSPIRAMARERQLRAAAAAPPVVAPPPPVNQRFAMLSISWTDSVTNQHFTLSGPFPKERLEELRKQIEASKAQLLHPKD